MTFVYPAQASELVSRRWQEFQDRQVSGRPLPDDGGSHRNTQAPFPSSENLDLILDITYHASFLVEEGRRLFIRLLYLPPLCMQRGHAAHAKSLQHALCNAAAQAVNCF